MSDEYRIDDINISKIVKQQRRDWASMNFYRFTQKFPIENVTYGNGVINFEMGGVKYVYAEQKNKIRKVGTAIWNSSPTKYLRAEKKKNIDDLLDWIDF